MVYLIAVFLSAISVAQSNSNDPCVTHDLNFQLPDALQYGSAAAGAAVSAALGYTLAKPPGYTYAEVLQWFQLDQSQMTENYSSIRKVQTAAERLRASYADYYQHYNREVLRPMLAERIAPAQNSFLKSLKGLYKILAPHEARSDVAAFVTNHRYHIARSVLRDLQSAMTELHEPHLKENSYSEIADKFVTPLNQALGQFVENIDATIRCEETLDSTGETSSEHEHQTLVTGLGGAIGAFAGWFGAEFIIHDVEVSALSSLLPTLCARIKELEQRQSQVEPPKSPSKSSGDAVVQNPPSEITTRGTHELDRQ